MRRLLASQFGLVIWVLVGGTILASAGLFSPTPRTIVPVGFILGFITFYLAYSAPIRNPKWIDVRMLSMVAAEGVLAAVFLLLACLWLRKPVCEPLHLRAQVFGNFIFVSIIIVLLWLSERLPMMIKSRGEGRER